MLVRQRAHIAEIIHVYHNISSVDMWLGESTWLAAILNTKTSLTVNFLNIRTPQNCCNHSKIWTKWLSRVLSPNDADGMANSVDPDQTAPRSSLIWVCTVRPGISVRKLMIVTVPINPWTKQNRTRTIFKCIAPKRLSIPDKEKKYQYDLHVYADFPSAYGIINIFELLDISV